MNKTIIEVPAGIRYLSSWPNFDLPQGPCIFNKKMPGCGFTEWVLGNGFDSLLGGPRRTLLGNKAEQHPGEVYYVINNFEESLKIDGDINSIVKKSLGRGGGFIPHLKIIDPKVAEENAKELERLKKEFFIKLANDIISYIEDRHSKGLPAKILVTYDSFSIVYNILTRNNLANQFKIYVDEFQSIFTDSKFKSTTEMKFAGYLSRCPSVYYASATPMMEEYLDKLDYFKDLPYYELDWETQQPGRIIKPDLKVLVSRSAITTAKKIIDKYKSGNFEYAVSPVTGQVVYSKEAVIYVNSVKNIIDIIKKCSLVPDEVNILCANTEENIKKVRKLGKKYLIGRVPLRGEQHKMFTFCTRTVYLGADFYSDNARSFIISDANLDTLAVDISLDLPQILGRQRLDENPWKNKATFYYKPLAERKLLTKKDFDDIIAKKLKETTKLIRVYSNNIKLNDFEAAEEYTNYIEDALPIFKYTKNFVAVDNIYDADGKVINKIPVINNLVMLSEQRAYDIQQIDYKDRFSVFNTINSVVNSTPASIYAEKFFKNYNNPNFRLSDKLEYLCTYPFSSQEEKDLVLSNITEHHFVDYYTYLGPDRCRASGYNVTKLNKEIGISVFDKSDLEAQVRAEFIVGKAYPKSYIKDKLAEIYKNVGYEKVAKAIDLGEWFVIRKTMTLNSNRERISSFKIIS